MKQALFLIFVSCAAAEPKESTLQVEEKVMHELSMRKEKFDNHCVGFSFTYQLMLLERLDRKSDKELFSMLSKALVKRYFEYFIQVELGLRKADKAVEMAFSSAVEKNLIDLNVIKNNQLNFGSAPEPAVKTPYGLVLDERANEELATRFREHVMKMTSPPQNTGTGKK